MINKCSQLFTCIIVAFSCLTSSAIAKQKRSFTKVQLEEGLTAQIDKSLDCLDLQLSKEFLDMCFNQFGDAWLLLRVTKKQGQLTFQYPPAFAKKPHSVQTDWRKIFERLEKLNRLPPLDFDLLLSAQDAIACPSCNSVGCSNGVFLYIRDDSIPLDYGRLPIFVQADCSHHRMIIFPDFLHLGTASKIEEIKSGSRAYSWETRKPVLFFRGGDSGVCRPEQWPSCQRPYLIQLSLQHSDLLDAKIALGCHNKHWEPYAFSHGLIGDYVSLKDHCRYKYLLDIDGNCASNPRNQLLMFSGSVILKAMTDSNSWYYPCCKPYVHFVPIQNDFSDLFEQLNWAIDHEQECREMTQRARLLADKLFSQDHIDSYIYHMLETYANKQRIYYKEHWR